MEPQDRSRLNITVSHGAHVMGVILLFGLAVVTGAAFGSWVMGSLKANSTLPFTSIPTAWVTGSIGMGAVLAFMGELRDAFQSLLQQAKAPSTLTAVQVALRLAFSVFAFTVAIQSIQQILADKPPEAPIVTLDGLALLGPRDVEPIATLPILHKVNAAGLTLSDEGIRLESQQIHQVGLFVETLDQWCRDPEFGRPIAMKVLGFASSKEFPTDNELNNTVVANQRGQAVKELLDDQLLQNDRASYFRVVTQSWTDYNEMIERRRVLDRIITSVNVDAEYLNRRVDIQLVAAGRCSAMQAVRVLLGRT